MKLDFKKKLILSIVLILLLTVVGCGKKEPISTGDSVETEEEEYIDEYLDVDKIPINLDNGVITIFGNEVDYNYYYLVQEETLWQVQFYDKEIILYPVAELTVKEVQELEDYSVGRYVDHFKLRDKDLVLPNEFVYIQDGIMTIENCIYNTDGEKMVAEVPLEYKEEMESALGGYVIDLREVF